MGLKHMKHRRLDIDFKRRRARFPWAGPLLFAIAAVFAADVGFSYAKVREASRKNEATLAQLEPRRERTARKASPEEIAAARETVQRLALPWDNLFRALEGAASEQVALLSIEPDPKAGTVLITGDGKDYLATLSYVLNLSQAQTLSRVQLVRHEARPGDRAVGFSVSASWK